MATIAKIRLCNVLYEGGLKRYNDETFFLDGLNTAFLLENGGGKTVLVQMILQAVLPRSEHAGRKIHETLALSSGATHIAVEWILDERPRRYLLTAVTLFLKSSGKLESYHFTEEYEEGHAHDLESLPLSVEMSDGAMRPASHGEMRDYYLKRKNEAILARTHDTLKDYHQHLESFYHISSGEWHSISKINSSEGGIEAFFDDAATTSQLVNNLLIPTVEEAIEGMSAEVFTEIFEQHRQHLKEYRRLIGVIDQNRLIQGKIDDYVSRYGVYQEAREAYDAEKSVMSGLYDQVSLEREQATEALQNTASDLAMLEAGVHDHNKRDKALRVERKRRSHEARYAEHRVVSTEYNSFIEGLEKEQAELDALELAAKLHDAREEEERAEQLEEQIAILDSEVDVQELIEKREGLLRQIAHSYAVERASLSESIAGLSDTLADQRIELDGEKAVISNLRDREKSLLGRIERLAATADQLDLAVKETERDLPGLEGPDHVESFLRRQKERLVQLEQKLAEGHQMENELAAERVQVDEELQDVTDQIGSLESKIDLKVNEINRIEGRSAGLYERYLLLTDKGTTNKNLYTDAHQVLSTLERELTQLGEERERVIRDESTANHHFHRYEGVERYVADPRFAEEVRRWRSQFGLLEWGADYLEDHVDQEQQVKLIAAYPEWAITLVCLSSERESLVRKVRLSSVKKEHPVRVMTDLEVIEHLQGAAESSPGHRVFPGHWIENLDPGIFDTWRGAIHEELVQHQERRRTLDERFKRLQSLTDEIRGFFSETSREAYDVLRESLALAREERAGLKESATLLKRRLQEIRSRLKTWREQERILDQEKAALERFIRDAQRMARDLKRLEEATREKSVQREKLEELLRSLASLAYQLAQREEKIETLAVERQRRENDLTLLERSDGYREVKDLEPLVSGEDRSILRQRVDHVDQLLGDRQKERGVLERERADAQKKGSRFREEAQGIAGRAQIDLATFEPLPFTETVVRRLEEGKDAVAKMNRTEKTVRSRLATAREKMDAVHAEWRLLLEEFHETFGEMITFDHPLEIVERDLKAEAERLAREKRRLLEEEKKQAILAKEIDLILQDLAVENRTYGFLSEKIESAPPTESLWNDYRYQREATVASRIEKLKVHREKVAAAGERKDEMKRSFRHFCEQKIHDPKLKHSTLAILEGRDDYDELLQWREQVKKGIGRVIEISEHSLREHDEEIVKLIDRLYVFLTRILSELAIIEQKTWVTFKEDRKKIFKITAPEVAESKGKEVIREHLVWMSTQVQESEYKKDDGTEDTERMKKEIGRWMSTKVLLGKFFGGKEISVKCRKVTNDLMISSSLTDWSHSNKWSGGEKWSKNMTLYLGIQNYIAEKRSADDRRMKRMRTVLLDNPFGAASSHHVLEPVFLIAEQLGYQLIAFTAHAEGRYISDYFPIVFSCKLRASHAPGKQVMTRDQQIRYAYLEDHAPTTLRRLNEEQEEQLSLFGV